MWGSLAGGLLVQLAKQIVKRLSALQDANLRGKTAYTVLCAQAQEACNHLPH